MADPDIISTLRRKQAELQDAISDLDGKLADAQSDLGHVTAVLHFYEIDGTALQFLAHVNISRLFKRGDLVALTKAVMEVSGEPMTTRRRAEAVVVGKGWEQADKMLRENVTYRLVRALTIAARRGTTDSPGKAGNVRLWASMKR